MRKQTIHFIMTGGTIDSFYDATKDTAAPNRKSVIPTYLKSLNLYLTAKFTQVCMKDSRGLTSADLKRILGTVEKSPHKDIIITHGTYTMPDTAKYLKTKLKRKDQVIVLTGSMIPLNGFNFSDAPFNLGFSIASLPHLKPGVYVCMNGRIFSPDEVLKFLSKGRFVSVFG